MNIEKIAKWRTDDGVEHTSPEMAEQHILNELMLDGLTAAPGFTRGQAQDILDILSGDRRRARQWLDACDAMEKAAFK